MVCPCKSWNCEMCNTTIRMEAQNIVTKCLTIPITIKKEELGLSKKHFIENRKIARKKAREKANEKKWEDMKATMARVREHVLSRGTSSFTGQAPTTPII